MSQTSSTSKQKIAAKPNVADASILQLCYRFTLDCQKICADFAKKHRYQLGDEISSQAFIFLREMTRAVTENRLPDKLQKLYDVDSMFLTLRLLMRLSRDLNLVSDGRFVEMQMLLDEIKAQHQKLLTWAHSQANKQLDTSGGCQSFRTDLNSFSQAKGVQSVDASRPTNPM